jgi:putative nucleotidyltransferase with HDIG domain
MERAFHQHDALHELQLAIQRAIATPSNYLTTGDPAERDLFTRLAAEVETHFASVEALIGEFEEERSLLDDARSKWQQIRARAEAVLALPAAAESADAVRLVEQLEPLADGLTNDLAQLHAQQEARIAAAVATTRRIWAWAKLILIFSLTLAVASRLTFVWYLFRAFAHPLIALTHAAEALGSGELKARVALGEEDNELTRLGRAFNAMAEVLEADLQRRTAEANALNAIATATVTAPDLQSVLETALEHLLPLLRLEAGSIFLPAEDDPNALVLAAKRGLPASFAHVVQRLPIDSGFVGQVYRTGQPVVLEDVATHAPSYLLAAIREHGWHAFAATPLCFRGRVLGVLVVSGRERRSLSAEDLAFLKAVGDQLGSGLENARLRREAQRHLQEVETLAALSQMLNQTMETGEVLDHALRVLTDQLELASAWFLTLRDDPQTPLTLAAALHLPPALQAEGAFDGTCLCQARALSGELTKAINVVKCERLAGQPPQATCGLYHHASVPVHSGGCLVGLLNLALPEGRHFTPEELRLLTAAAETLGVALGRARLHERVAEQRVLEQETLLRFSRRLLGLLEPESVACATFEVLKAHLQPDAISLLVLDAHGTHLELIAAEGWASTYVGHMRLPLQPPESSGVAWAVHTRKPVIRDHTREDGPIRSPKGVREAGVQASLIVPVLVSSAENPSPRVVGVLVLDSLAARRFSEDEVRFVSVVAGQTAVALERARAYQTARRRQKQLAILNDLAREMTGLLEVEELCSTVARRLRQAFGYLNIGIFTVDSVTEEVVLRGVSGAYEPLVQPGRYRQALGEGIIGQAAKSGQTLVINDTRQHPGFFDLEGMRVHAELAIPLKVGDRVIGVLNVDSEQINAFDASDVTILTTVGDQLAVALEKAHLFHETRARAMQMARLASLGEALNRPFTRAGVIEAIGRGALALSRADRAAVYLREPDDTVSCPWSQGLSPEYVAQVTARAQELPGGRLAESIEPVFVSDVAALPENSPFRELAASEGYRALALWPLVYEGRVVAAVGCYHDTPCSWHAAEQEVMATFCRQAAVALENARLYGALEDAYVETIVALANAMDARDAYTADHSERLAAWAEATARELGCSEEEIQAVRWAALLHDIGKIGVPDHILRKPGPLDETEWEVIRRHPEVGARIVAPVKKLAAVVPIIRAHQEHWDGSGYPDGLKGEAIPLGARIVAVVDAYGAIVDERPYKPARSHEEAVAELRRCAGTQFDPRVVEAFLKTMMNAE